MILSHGLRTVSRRIRPRLRSGEDSKQQALSGVIGLSTLLHLFASQFIRVKANTWPMWRHCKDATAGCFSLEIGMRRKPSCLLFETRASFRTPPVRDLPLVRLQKHEGKRCQLCSPGNMLDEAENHFIGYFLSFVRRGLRLESPFCLPK